MAGFIAIELPYPEDLKYFKIISKMTFYFLFSSRHIANSMQVPQQFTEPTKLYIFCEF